MGGGGGGGGGRVSLENTGEGGGGANCHLKKKKQKYIIKFISRKTHFSFTSLHAPTIKVITVTQL